jgi:hypothetical protein
MLPIPERDSLGTKGVLGSLIAKKRREIIGKAVFSGLPYCPRLSPDQA